MPRPQDVRFFPEEDDDKSVRNAYRDDSAKANDYLFRRVDIHDAVDAHLLAWQAHRRSASASTSSARPHPSSPRICRSCARRVAGGAAPRTGVRGRIRATGLADVPEHRAGVRQPAGPGGAGVAAALRFQVHPRAPGCGGRSEEPACASDRIEGLPCRRICGWPVPCRIDAPLDRTRAGPARFGACVDSQAAAALSHAHRTIIQPTRTTS